MYNISIIIYILLYCMNNQSNKNNWVPEKEKIQQYSADTLSRAQQLFIDRSLDDDIYSFDWIKNVMLVEKFKNFLPNFWFSELFWDFDLIYNAKTEESENKKNALIKALRMKIVSSLIPRNNRLDKLLWIFEKEYDISTEDTEKIKNILIWKKGDEVDAMMKSENKRLKFAQELKKFRGITIIDTKENVDSFNKKLKVLWIDSLQYETLSFEQKNALEKFNQVYSDISYEDARAIISIFPSKKKKLILLQTFMPYVKVWKLLSWGIIDLKEVRSEIKSQVKEELWKISEAIFSDAEIDNVVLSVDYGEIYLDLEKINIDGDIIADIELESAIVSEVNELKKNVRKSELNDFYNHIDFEWWEKTFHKNFLDFIKKSKEIPLSIKNNIDKFVKWNFLVIKTKNNSDLILEIGETNVWNFEEWKKIKFFDRTTTGGMNKSKEYNLSYSYEKIFALFKGSDHKEWLEIDFLTENEIKDKKQYKEVFDISLLDSEVSDEDKITTLKELETAFDIIDPAWAGIPFTKDDMVLHHSWESETIYTIFGIDERNKKITLDDGKARVDFTEFLSICKKNNIKRKKKIKNSEEFLSSLSSLGWDVWKNYKDLEISSSLKISKKPHWDIVETCDIFVWDNWESIWIEEISDGSIKCHFWTYDEKKKNFEWKYGYTSFEQAFVYISKYKMNPVFEKEEHHDEHGDHHDDHEHHPHPHFHGSLLTKYMSFLSAHDISHAFHQVAHSIEHSFWHGSQLKSAKFALKLWKLIPSSHLRGDLQSTVEQEERKIREEIMTNLKARWSTNMLETIKHILQGSDMPQYEVEAAMLTVLSKYGTLYPKGLSSMRWDFYWYTRLGWKIGDSFFEETKKKCEDSQESGKDQWKSQPIPFTEEYLVEELMWKHAKAWIRDSRIDKLYGNALWEGIRDEKADGEMKAGNKNTSKWRVDYVLGELKGGWYANAFWALPKVFSKNDSIEDLHAVPFIITISWIAKNFDQRLLNDIAGITFTTPFTSLWFNLKSKNIDLYKKAMLEIAKSLDIEDNEWIEKSLIAALNCSSDTLKIEALEDFWKKYGARMVKRLTLKDHYIMIHKKDNDVLSSYYDVMKWIQTNDGDYNPKTEYIDEKWFSFEKTPIAYTWALLWENDITLDQSAEFRWSISRKNFDMYVETLISLKKSNFSEEDKKRIFKEVYWLLENKMSRLLSYHIDRKTPETLRLLPAYKDMQNYWLIVSTEGTYRKEFEDNREGFLNKAREVFRNANEYWKSDEKEVEIVKKWTAEGIMNQLFQNDASNEGHRKK